MKEITVKISGREHSLSELSQTTGLSLSTIQSRYKRGDQGARLLRPKDTCAGRIAAIVAQAYGRNWTVAEIAKHIGLGEDAIRYRLKRGDVGEVLFRKPGKWACSPYEADYGKEVHIPLTSTMLNEVEIFSKGKDPGEFIRAAIQEKLDREKKQSVDWEKLKNW